MFGSAPLLYIMSKHGRIGCENDVNKSKMTSKCQNRHTDIMHERRLRPPHKRQHFLALVGFLEILVGYARIFNLQITTIKDSYKLWLGVVIINMPHNNARNQNHAAVVAGKGIWAA